MEYGGFVCYSLDTMKETTVKFKHWEHYKHLVHGYSTRDLGSLSTRSGNSADIERNREQFAQEMGIDWKNILHLPTTHSNTIAVIEHEKDVILDDRGLLSITQAKVIPAKQTIHHVEKQQLGIDGVIVTIPNVFPVLLTGDCIAVSLFDPEQHIVGLAHAGRVGTVNEIVSHIVKIMKERYGTNPEKLEVTLSPSVRSCCYTWSNQNHWEQFYNDVVDYYGKEVAPLGKPFDLHTWVTKQLLEEGVIEDHIYDIGRCTACEYDSFFSDSAARTPEQKKLEGRFGNIIGIKK